MNLAFPLAFLPWAFSGCPQQCYSFCVHYGFPGAFPWDTQKDEGLWAHFGEQRISLPSSFQDWPRIICIVRECCPVDIFTMILKKQINFCKVYAYVGKTWKDQWKRKVRIENLLNFDMCSPIHIHIHQQSVEALLQVYEHAFEPSRCLS